MTPAIPQAIIDKAAAHARLSAEISTEPAIAIVWHERRKDWAFYSADAWERPSEAPLLAWSPPAYPALAIVQPDGSCQLV